MTTFLIAASVPDSKALFCLIPLPECPKHMFQYAMHQIGHLVCICRHYYAVQRF